MGRISGQQRYAKDVQYKINDMKDNKGMLKMYNTK